MPRWKVTRVTVTATRVMHHPAWRREVTMTKAGARIALKTILFATDFSPAANSALPYATDLASRFGAKLVVVHAKEPPNYALPPDAWRTPDDATEAGVQELKKSLAKSFPKIESSFRIGEGRAWQVIEAVIEQSPQGRNRELWGATEDNIHLRFSDLCSSDCRRFAITKSQIAKSPMPTTRPA